MNTVVRVSVLCGVIVALILGACAGPAPTSAPAAPAASSASTSTQAPAGAANKPSAIKLGFINHLTGDAAQYGQAAKQGTELAVDLINAKGGVNGVPLQVVYEDDRLSAADAQTAVLKLIQSDKVTAVLGSTSSSISLSICPKAQEAKVVHITDSTSPQISNCGKYTFGVMASDTAQGPEWAKVAEYFKAKEAAVMYINNDYGIGLKDSFTQSFEKAGGKVLIAQPFEVGGKDFRTEILKVKVANPKIIFIGSHMAEGSTVIKQAKELGLDTQWVTDVSMVSKELPQLAGAASEGVIGLRAGAANSAEYKAYTEAFKKKFNAEPTIWSEYNYDAVMLVAKAIEKGGFTSDAIQQALPAVANDYVGPSGPKKFENNMSLGAFDWMTVKDGQWVVYEKK